LLLLGGCQLQVWPVERTQFVSVLSPLLQKAQRPEPLGQVTTDPAYWLNVSQVATDWHLKP
jgi:hypothetical protein